MFALCISSDTSGWILGPFPNPSFSEAGLWSRGPLAFMVEEKREKLMRFQI